MSIKSMLAEMASDLVPDRPELNNVERSMSAIQNRAGEYFGSSLKQLIWFGSSTRGTRLPHRVDERADVDVMMFLDDAENLQPASMISKLKRFAEDSYPRSVVHQSAPAVVIRMNHIWFDLVPAKRSLLGIKIPASRNSLLAWMGTDPASFNQELQTRNQSCGQQIKPLIRIVKYWNVCAGRLYESYELEQDIVRTGYLGCSSLWDYVYTGMCRLSTAGLGSSKREKVSRAKQIVRNAKVLESQGFEDHAENELMKLFPE